MNAEAFCIHLCYTNKYDSNYELDKIQCLSRYRIVHLAMKLDLCELISRKIIWIVLIYYLLWKADARCETSNFLSTH